MELLYVVELDVRTSVPDELTPSRVRDRVLDHLATWVSSEHTPTITREVFDVAGREVLRSERDDRADTRVSWTTEGTETARAFVAVIRTEIAQSGRADFVCTVTVYTERERTSVRVELARESLDNVLAPIGSDFFRRPFLFVHLLRDADLQCWSGPTRVDGRFDWVNHKHVDVVWQAISAEDRLLPILLVDGDADQQFMRRAASELAGLANVLAVDSSSQRLLQARLSDFDATIPRGGARLVWPDLALRHPAFTSNQIGIAVGRLLRMLSSVSVAVRGVNLPLRTAQIAQRNARNAQIALDLAEAQAGGDLAVEIDAQKKVIELLKEEANQYEAWFRQVEDERDRFKAQAAQAAYWKQEAERARRASGLPEVDWSEAPPLDESDLTDLANFLEKKSVGSIAFTRESHQAWKKDAYLHVEVMRKALIVLTQASIEYRRLDCQLGMVPDDWFKQEWDLTLASTDKYMSKNRLDTFTYDGETHSRLPHLKLGDYTAPNEVGRVYFAMDSDNKRFIVDHVGLKLYGL